MHGYAEQGLQLHVAVVFEKAGRQKFESQTSILLCFINATLLILFPYMIDNYSTSLSINDPEIKEVLNLKSGVILSTQEAIGYDYGKLEHLRMALAESIENDQPLYVCPICGVGIYLACRRNHDEKRFYFKHRFEDNNCPAITRGNLSKEEIEARKYNGVKESAAHIKIKEIVAGSLANDTNFSDIKIEEVWKGQDRVSWRKPDVRALWKNEVPVAFEIQLSTTFLHVIAQRRLFYREQGGLLCWVFHTFDTQLARMTQDDVFFNNNRNLFLASEETLRVSRQQQSMTLDCHWSDLVVDSGKVIEKWNGRFVEFSELTQDLEGQWVFLFDYDKQKEQLKKQVTDEALRQRFEHWWTSFKGLPPNNEIWQSFRQEFIHRNVFLPDAPIPEYPVEVVDLLNALYTAKAGKVIGWKHQNFISAAHTVTQHKKTMRYFAAALNVYDRKQQLKAEDKEGKWANKVEEYIKRLETNDPDYERNSQFDSLTAFLFPEVWAKINSKKNK